MNIPNDLRYTKEHEWVRLEGDVATIGITDYAQGELGDIVFIEVDTVDESAAADEVFGTIEAVKTVSDMFAPVAGEVIEFNEALEDAPESGLHATPGTDLPQETLLDLLHADKAIHFVMFAVLSSSVFVALGKTGTIRKYKWYAGLALLLYGIGLEFAQDMWLVGREASWGDILADGTGVLAGRVAFRGIYGCWN